MRDATFMWLVPGVKQRILAVVEPGVAQSLEGELQRGLIPPATVIKIINLPAEMRDALETFRVGAANEVTSVRKEKAPHTGVAGLVGNLAKAELRSLRARIE